MKMAFMFIWMMTENAKSFGIYDIDDIFDNF